MKKLFLFACIVGSFTALPTITNAQISPTVLKSATGYSKDTVTAATAKYLTYVSSTTGKGLITGKQTIYVVATGQEISGTTSGSLRIEASADSVTWYPYYLGTAQVDTAGSNYRLTLQDATGKQSIRWVLKDFGDSYLRVAALGGGTTNWSAEGKLWGKL